MNAYDELKTASDDLSRPLKFGDQKQIAAVRMVETIQACIDAATACQHEGGDCPDCDGSGEVDCECDCGNEHQKHCDSCDGSGVKTEKGCEECLALYAKEQIETARRVMRDGWPKGLQRKIA